MLTRTAALDYAFDGIWMGSVDTGWITHEIPPLQQHHTQQAALHTAHFSPPLDAVDAAARCLDPVRGFSSFFLLVLSKGLLALAAFPCVRSSLLLRCPSFYRRYYSCIESSMQVFQALKGKSIPFGQFYKDYNPTYW
jgi:hypothetical protein